MRVRCARRVVALVAVAVGAVGLAGCGTAPEVVRVLDVSCDSPPGGYLSRRPAEVAPGTELRAASLRLEGEDVVAEWVLAGDHTDTAVTSDEARWNVALLSPRDDGAYLLEVTRRGAEVSSRVSGGGPSGDSAGGDVGEVVAEGDRVSVRVPRSAMAEIGVDWLWSANTLGGDPVTGYESDHCFGHSPADQVPLETSGRVEP